MEVQSSFFRVLAIFHMLYCLQIHNIHFSITQTGHQNLWGDGYWQMEFGTTIYERQQSLFLDSPYIGILDDL